MLPEAELEGILSFLRAAERLKSLPRSGWTTAGERESVAAHSWRLGLMAALLADRFEGIDLARLLKICLIHDLGEALSGDTPAPLQSPEGDKAARERSDLEALLEPLPQRLRLELAGLWEEYEAAGTPEARLAKGLDKLETILQHTQGSNPADFDYNFNLTYGQSYTSAHPLLAALRLRLDRATAAREKAAAMTRDVPAPIRSAVTVAMPAADAFELFTDRLDTWWPREYTWSQQALQRIGMESKPDGKCYELGPHGFRCDWGRILAWEPPRRLLLAWQISPRREPEPDPSKASEVEVTFQPGPDNSTLVVLSHRGFERHGPGAADYRAALAAGGGWPRILSCYAAAAG